jgi:hypothetical protein
MFMKLKPNADIIKHFIHPSITSCEYAHVNCFQNALAYRSKLPSQNVYEIET